MDKERLWLGLPLATVPQDTLPSSKNVLRVLHELFSKKHEAIQREQLQNQLPPHADQQQLKV